jgi:hypothetical protein
MYELLFPNSGLKNVGASYRRANMVYVCFYADYENENRIFLSPAVFD